MREPLALAVGDLHFSAKRPIARHPDENWLAVQAGYLAQLSAIHPELPLILAGDVFDTWNQPPEVINMVLDGLRHSIIYAVPGQHDLPYHDYEKVSRSAYYTLCAAGRVTDLLPSSQYRCCGFETARAGLHGFPWGTEPTPAPDMDELQIAVVHAYCWAGDACHPGAKEDDRADAWKAKLPGYGLRIFGDNHKAFSVPGVLNGGNFINRKADERANVPCVWLIYSDGSVEPIPLDTSKDRWDEVRLDKGNTPKYAKFVHGLGTLGTDTVDFRKVAVTVAGENGVQKEMIELFEGLK